MDLEKVDSSSATVVEGAQLQRLREAVVAVVESENELRDIVVDELRHVGVLGVGLDSAEALYRYLLGGPCDIVLLDARLNLAAELVIKGSSWLFVAMTQCTGAMGGKDDRA